MTDSIHSPSAAREELTRLSPIWHRPRSFGAATMLVALVAGAPPALAGRTQAPAREGADAVAPRLDVGTSVERQIAGGQTHRYVIRLDAGQLLKGVVEQKGVDVALVLLGPSGAVMLEVDSPNGANGPEPLILVADASGDYALEVKTYDPADKGGSYEARVDEVRAATEQDRLVAEATRLFQESLRLRFAGKLQEAIALVERAVPLMERALGPDHPDVAESLSDLASIYGRAGAAAKAESLYVRALAIAEKALGSDHLDVARSLEKLAGLYQAQGAYTRAEPLYVRVLAIREKALGPDHPDVAGSLNDLAWNYREQGFYAKPEPLFGRALAIYEKVLGPDDPAVAESLNFLGLLYWDRGVFAKAEPLLVRSLTIREKAFGPDHLAVSKSLNDLALVYQDQGAYARAEPLFLRALAIREQVLGADHIVVGTSLNNLASLYEDQGAYAKVEPLFLRALANYEKAYGPDHPYVGLIVSNLALLYWDQRAYTKAEPLFVRALAISEKAHGPDHPDTSASLLFLALLCREQGAYAKGEPLLARAIEIRERVHGPDHPSLARGLVYAAQFHWAAGDLAKAFACQARAGDVREREYLLNLSSGSERSKLLYIAKTAPEQDVAVSLHVLGAPSDPAGRRVAMETILRRKGRALDVMSDAIAALRRRSAPEDQRLLDELSETRARLTALTLRGPSGRAVAEHRAEIDALEARGEQLEAQISARSSEFRAAASPITLDTVRARIPDGAVLVEFASYRPFDPKTTRFAPSRYVVYVAGRSGEIAWADLGETARVDAAVKALTAALRDPKADLERTVKPQARRLDELVFRPVRRLAGASRRLLVAPDGALNLVPFDALVDERGRFAVERYEVSYLTSGRDLLRPADPGEGSGPVCVFANPDFGPVPAGAGDRRELALAAAESGAPAAAILADVFFQPLAGTAGEAAALRDVVPGARILTGAEATKAALERLDSPRILHVATHGFFLAADPATPPDAGGRALIRDVGADSGPVAGGSVENPLLRSGLALAGANLHRGGDGILTALEVSGLDLWGTKLVVLSACDTGIGEVKTGDGVYGLRRALVLAGSETQVMSLWPVSDQATRDLMVAYYRALVAGEGRSAAMRRVRLAMLKDSKRRHPFFWASFIVSGDWRPLSAE